MSSFKYYRNNKHRYNIYEDNSEPILVRSYYKPLRNTLFFISIILTLFIGSLITFDIYQKQTNNTSKTLLSSQIQKASKYKITKLELTQVISKSLIKRKNRNNTLENFNQQQIKLIIKRVIEKVEKSSNKITHIQT